MTTTTPGTGTVLPLPVSTDYRIAGRKAATLARLATRGFPVQPGVVVPADVLDRAVGRNLEVPADTASDLLSGVRPWGDVPLAVRSSGVDEDSADASYAGLFTTVLDVRGEAALIDAVRACWRSAFDARVSSYAGAKPPRLAVLVQPMVAATAAGIAFTADPVTGERNCVVINALAGIGERLASGAATPDRWVVRGDDVHQQSAAEAAIDERRARSVADLARRVEAELGGSQDIEWALVDDEVVLLQARPITALPVPPVPIPIEVPPGYWTRETSHAPLPWLPFTKAFTDTMNAATRRMAAEFGLLVDGPEFRKIGGWEYMRIVPVGGREPPPLPLACSACASARPRVTPPNPPVGGRQARRRARAAPATVVAGMAAGLHRPDPGAARSPTQRTVRFGAGRPRNRRNEARRGWHGRPLPVARCPGHGAG
jgi:rifampicin phosphotransferase